jgi:hypothetical protein
MIVDHGILKKLTESESSDGNGRWPRLKGFGMEMS